MEDTLDRRLLAASVAPYLHFALDGEMLLEPAFERLTDSRKIVCVLLGRKILRDRGLLGDERIPVMELAAILNRHADLLRRHLSGELRDIVAEEGRWIWVPNRNVPVAKAFLESSQPLGERWH